MNGKTDGRTYDGYSMYRAGIASSGKKR